jgi:hypothetical protein
MGYTNEVQGTRFKVQGKTTGNPIKKTEVRIQNEEEH